MSDKRVYDKTNPDDVRHLISLELNLIKKREEELNQAKDINVKIRKLNSLEFAYMYVGRLYVCLKDFSSAMEYFKKHVNCIIELINLGGTISDTQSFHVFIDSLLSRDENLRRMLADGILKGCMMDPGSPKLIYEYVIVLSKLIKGTLTMDEIQKYYKIEEKEYKYISGRAKGTAAVIDGIVNKNKNRVIEGALSLLQHYNRSWKRSGDFPFCYEATALLRLAVERGIEIDLEKDIPQRLRFLVPKEMVF